MLCSPGTGWVGGSCAGFWSPHALVPDPGFWEHAGLASHWLGPCARGSQCLFLQRPQNIIRYMLPCLQDKKVHSHDYTKILQVVLPSRVGEWVAVSLYAWRRDAPHFCHTLEDLRRFQLVSPLINSRTGKTVQALLVWPKKNKTIVLRQCMLR